MNILLLNWRDLKHPQAGGAEIHYHELCRRLVLRGHRVVLLTTRFRGCSTFDTQDGIEIVRRGHTYTFNFETPFLVPPLLKKYAIDCIIDDVNKIPFFSPKIFGTIPTGVFFHHLFGKTIFDQALYPLALYILFLENRCGWAYKNIPCCTVSKSTTDDLVAHGFNREKITIIENSVDTDLYRPGNPAVKESDLLLYTGRIKRYKNVSIILEAMAALRLKGRTLRLVIAGSGDDEAHLHTRVRDLNLAALVTFAGYVDEAQKIMLYHRAALFINPSFKEGWGITNIEANACGTAVIANDAPGLRDSVQNGVSGILYQENQLADLVCCIKRLLDNAEERRQFEKNGREWSLKFSWDNSALRMEEWLKTCVLKKY